MACEADFDLELTICGVHSAIPASALDEELQDDDDDEPTGESRDDERSGTKYNVRIYLLPMLLPPAITLR